MQIHGGISGEELQGLDREIVDFSVSVNPCAPLPYINNIADIDKYPSRMSEKFCRVISNFYKISPDEVLPLGGATEGIYLLPNFFSSPAGIFPIYGDYLDAFSRYNIEVEEFKTLPDLCDSDLFLIVNPQNPTGDYYTREQICAFARRNPHTTVVIDEAYQEMGQGCESCIGESQEKNIVVLRSLTKATGWPSLRAGFFVGDSALLSKFKQRVLPWQITSQQLNLIEYFYDNYDQFRGTWNHFDSIRTQLLSDLSELPLEIIDGRAPFITFILPKNVSLQQKFFREYGLLIRDCSSFGLENNYRIMPQCVSDNRKLLSAMKDILC